MADMRSRWDHQKCLRADVSSEQVEVGQTNQNENAPRYPYLPHRFPQIITRKAVTPALRRLHRLEARWRASIQSCAAAVPGQDYTKLRYVFEWLHGGAGQIDPIVIVSRSPSVAVPFPGYCPPNRQTQKGCPI